MTGGGFKGGGGLEIGGGASFSMAAKLSQTPRPGKRFAVLFSLTPGFSPVKSLCEKHFLNGIIIETFGGGQRLFWHELD